MLSSYLAHWRSEEGFQVMTYETMERRIKIPEWLIRRNNALELNSFPVVEC